MLLLLIGFALALSGITQESIWWDEAWSIGVARSSWPTLLQLIKADVHPPLYFLVLKLWIVLAGEQVYAVRFLSAGFGLLGAATTFAIAKRLSNTRSAVFTLLWLTSSGLYVYYSREARMYSLLLWLTVLSIYFYIRWLDHTSSSKRLWAFLISIGLLLYTHYAGLFIAVSITLHLLWFMHNRLNRAVLVVGIMIITFLPWVPVLLGQMEQRFNGIVYGATSTSWASTKWILTAYSGGLGLLIFLPYFISRAGIAPRLRQPVNFSLIAGWVLISPLAMLLLNWRTGSFYEIRFLIGILPAVAIIIGSGLGSIQWRPLCLIFTILFLYTGLTSINWIRGPKAPWESVFRSTLAQRSADEPTFAALIEPLSVERYYDRQLDIRNEKTIDLSRRSHSIAELYEVVDATKADPDVWIIMPTNIGETWLLLYMLASERRITYRSSINYMVLYRLTQGGPRDLSFRLGETLAYTNDSFAVFDSVQRGKQSCFSFEFATLATLEPRYSIALHLIDRHNQLIAQMDQWLEVAEADTKLDLQFCLDVPVATQQGQHFLMLVVYERENGQRFNVYEKEILWGNSMVIGAVDIR